MNVRHLITSGLVLMALPAMAATIYSGLDDIAIPTGFTGIYLDIDTGATSSTAFAGWDVNPFFGGVGFGNSAAFQPARTSANNLAAVLNLAPGTIVSSGLSYASGVGGSGNSGHEHLGPATNQFQPGSEGYFGFRFTTNGSAGPYFGWMRVVFTANDAGAVVKDWAYDTTAAAISTGNIRQSAPSGGSQTTTLSGGSGETYTLGAALTDGGATSTHVLKTGAGIWSLAGDHDFTGATTVSGGRLDLGSSGKLSQTAAVTINAGGTLLLGGAAGADQIHDTAAMTLAGGRLGWGGLAGLNENVGALTLSSTSTIDFGTAEIAQQLRFQDSHLKGWTGILNVWNWTAGVDRLHFGTDSSGLIASQLNAFRFYSDSGLTLLGDSAAFTGSFGEVVPVPEPASALVALGLLALGAVRECGRRRAPVICPLSLTTPP